ncbi:MULTISPECIES: type IV pilin N-terminal domain-containing protein [Halomicrobium]|nr:MULTISPECIES: type IV pilin N-terminal domain-containing protein [Halomicrobium]QCD65798.1 hypothetical protein E5139_09195 [Halomicrobium mukohataei]QFR20603.1 hypothetical protein GBQ70_09190 [Halomicrobium sp. ZPS1]
MDQTRRALLRAVPLSVTAGLAGCSALSGDDEPATDTATDTPTPEPVLDGDSSATEWLFPPSALERDNYPFVTLHPSAMLEYADALPEARVSNLQSDIGLSGFDTIGSLDGLYQFGQGVAVYDGPFDRDPLVAELTEAGFEEIGATHGFDRYTPDDERLVAVGESDVLLVDLRGGDLSVTADSVAGAALDAVTGEGDRYQDVSDDCATLLDALGTGHVRTGRIGSTALDGDGGVAQGARWRVDSETTAVTAATVFESADATDEDAVASWAAASGPFGETAPATASDGRVVSATADVPTGELGPFELSSSPDAAPQVALDFDYDADAGTVTVTHNGGDSVPATRLELRGDGFAERDSADQSESGLWNGETSGDDETVVAGDSVVVGVTPTYRLFVLYSPESGRGVTLGSSSGPEA